jgi:glycosyltransferase involved in cell wall biosynthesis
MTTPFLSIVTRHLECRKKYFLRCALSIARQTSHDFEHIVIDCQPDGYLQAQQVLVDNCHRINGEYVFMLDDDDYLCNPYFISDLACFKTNPSYGNPDVIWCKWKTIGIYDNIPFPPPDEWARLAKGEPPRLGKVGTSCFVVKRQLYIDNIHAAMDAAPNGDYGFISAVYRNNPGLEIAMWDEFGAAYDHIGHQNNRLEDLDAR